MEQNEISEEQAKRNREIFKQRLISEGKIPTPDKDGKKSVYGYREPWE